MFQKHQHNGHLLSSVLLEAPPHIHRVLTSDLLAVEMLCPILEIITSTFQPVSCCRHTHTHYNLFDCVSWLPIHLHDIALWHLPLKIYTTCQSSTEAVAVICSLSRWVLFALHSQGKAAAGWSGGHYDLLWSHIQTGERVWWTVHIHAWSVSQ